MAGIDDHNLARYIIQRQHGDVMIYGVALTDLIICAFDPPFRHRVLRSERACRKWNRIRQLIGEALADHDGLHRTFKIPGVIRDLYAIMTADDTLFILSE